MKKTVLFTGVIGSGKTTIFNELTKSNQKTWVGGDVVTREVCVKDSQYGEGFTIIDMPGFGWQDNINTISAHFKVLENIEISRIMVFAHQERFFFMTKNCNDIIQVFQRYKDKITIVITCFDQCDAKQFKQELIQYFQKLQIKSFIFASKQDSGETLCKLFDSEIKYSQAQKIQLTETEMLNQLKCDDEEFLQEFYLALGDLDQCLSKQLIQLRKMDGLDFLEIYKAFIKIVIEKCFKKFNSLSIQHKNDAEKCIIYNDFLTKFFDQILHVAEQKMNQWEQNKIELKNFIENEMRSTNKDFESGRQQCIQIIRENAKKQKINYL